MPSPLGSPPLKRSSLFILSAVALMVGMQDAQAWGFGRAQSSAVLGLPLDFSVGLRLDPSETAPECLSAEVLAGDIPVPRSAVYVSLEASPGGPALRVRTSVAIDEPVVTVRLTAGCASSASRRFTLFADPPGHLASPALPQAEAVQAAMPAAAPTPAPASVPTSPPQAASPAPASVSAVEQPRAAAVVAAGGATAAPAASLGASAPPGAGRALRNPGPRAPASPTSVADADGLSAQRGPARAPRSKLQLDAPSVLMQAPGAALGAGAVGALASAQEAASAARAAASAAQARAAEMQKSIEALRQEAQANREAVARLTQALADAQSGPSGGLWAALAALAGLSALLFVRLRRLQGPAGPSPWWMGGAAAAPPDARPNAVENAVEAGSQAAIEVPPQRGLAGGSDTTTLPSLQPTAVALPALEVARLGTPDGGGAVPSSTPASAGSTLSTPAGDEAHDPGGAVQGPEAADQHWAPDPASLPSVTIDELLDLQQQVEFFLVLGQEDAALKLLVEHLRLTRGDFPLPHLQLMDMYRRRGDRLGFDGVREQFQRRFAVACPDWSQGPVAPRELEDAPGLLLDIERVWHDPAQAMGVLEELLRAADRIDSLQPAVQSDLLFLFTLARDLHDQPAPVQAPSAAVSTPAVVALVTPRPVQPVQPAQAVPAGQGVDFDLDLALPSGTEPELDLPLDLALDLAPPAPAAGTEEFPRGAEPVPPLQPVQALPVIDLPLAGAEGRLAGSAVASPVSRASGTLGSTGGAANVADLDLSLEENWSPVAIPAPPSPVQPVPALSLDFPDLALPGAAPAAAASALAKVDLELSFDDVEMAELPAPLSPGEERAASRFSLFSEEFGPAKKR